MDPETCEDDVEYEEAILFSDDADLLLDDDEDDPQFVWDAINEQNTEVLDNIIQSSYISEEVINSCTEDGSCALHLSAIRGNIDFSAFLLQNVSNFQFKI